LKMLCDCYCNYDHKILMRSLSIYGLKQLSSSFTLMSYFLPFCLTYEPFSNTTASTIYGRFFAINARNSDTSVSNKLKSKDWRSCELSNGR
jgi:hypothetical protein